MRQKEVKANAINQEEYIFDSLKNEGKKMNHRRKEKISNSKLTSSKEFPIHVKRSTDGEEMLKGHLKQDQLTKRIGKPKLEMEKNDQPCKYDDNNSIGLSSNSVNSFFRPPPNVSITSSIDSKYIF